MNESGISIWRNNKNRSKKLTPAGGSGIGVLFLITTVFFLFFLLFFMVMPAGAAEKGKEIPPEELDRIMRARAARERAKIKAEQKAKEEESKTQPQAQPVRTYPRRTHYSPLPAKIEPGIFVIESVPAGAQIYINGKPAGKTPYTIKEPPGAYSLRLEFAGHEEIEAGVIIHSNVNKRILLHLEPK